jgi:hypothetical protein
LSREFRQERTTRTGRSTQIEHDRQTGQAEQDIKTGKAVKDLQEKDYQTRAELPGQEKRTRQDCRQKCQDRFPGKLTKTGLPGLDCQIQYSQER